MGGRGGSRLWGRYKVFVLKFVLGGLGIWGFGFRFGVNIASFLRSIF